MNKFLTTTIHIWYTEFSLCRAVCCTYYTITWILTTKMVSGASCCLVLIIFENVINVLFLSHATLTTFSLRYCSFYFSWQLFYGKVFSGIYCFRWMKWRLRTTMTTTITTTDEGEKCCFSGPFRLILIAFWITERMKKSRFLLLLLSVYQWGIGNSLLDHSKNKLPLAFT